MWDRFQTYPVQPMYKSIRPSEVTKLVILNIAKAHALPRKLADIPSVKVEATMLSLILRDNLIVEILTLRAIRKIDSLMAEKVALNLIVEMETHILKEIRRLDKLMERILTLSLTVEMVSHILNQMLPVLSLVERAHSLTVERTLVPYQEAILTLMDMKDLARILMDMPMILIGQCEPVVNKALSETKMG